jgi:dephospho-CoA kinase
VTRVVGLTGGIGAGKSTVARLLAGKGAHVIDVDAVCKAVIEPDGAAHAGLVARFGAEVVGANGALDRVALARQVFSDPGALEALTGLSHPAANEVMAAEVAGLPAGSLVILDMAVLAEYPQLGRWPGGGYGTVVVVTAPEEVRVGRLVSGRGMADHDARARIANQKGDEDRLALADHVVDNSGDPAALDLAVDRLWQALTT